MQLIPPSPLCAEDCDRSFYLGLEPQARVPQCTSGLVMACTAPSLTQRRGLEPRQVPACPPLKSRSGCNCCWLQLSAAQNGKRSPSCLCAAGGRTELPFCLGCSQSGLLGIPHGPGMWLSRTQGSALFSHLKPEEKRSNVN